MNVRFDQLRTTYNNSFQSERGRIRSEIFLQNLGQLPPDVPYAIRHATQERKHIVATLAKIFDFLDSVFSAEDFRSRLNKNSLEYLQEEGRNLNRLLVAVNEDLSPREVIQDLSPKADSDEPSSPKRYRVTVADTSGPIQEDPIQKAPIQEDPMYKDIWETSQKLLAFLNGGFEAFFKQVEHLLPNPPNQAQAERKEARP
jgi:hypothetical protein